MNVVKISIIAVCLFCSFKFYTITAQEKEIKGTIRGKVIDTEGKFPLMGVNIVVKENNMGAATDSNGIFEIKNMPVGSYSLIFSYIGYEKIIQTDIIIRSGRVTTLDVELKSGSLSCAN